MLLAVWSWCLVLLGRFSLLLCFRLARLALLPRLDSVMRALEAARHAQAATSDDAAAAALAALEVRHSPSLAAE
jgi:hypothetical protein